MVVVVSDYGLLLLLVLNLSDPCACCSSSHLWFLFSCMLFLSLFLLIEVLLCAKPSQNVGVHKVQWFLLPVSFLFAWVCCQVN